MKTLFSTRTIIITSILIILFLPVFIVSANTNERFNNENWFTLPHPRVASFSVNADGSAFGLTENGIAFVQFNVPNTYGMRIQRFEIQDHYHYIVDGEIVNSFTEFSALLAKAYNYMVTEETV